MANNTRLDARVLEGMIKNNPDKLGRALREEAQDIVADIRLSFGTSPSSPGDPPGVDTGALRASMNTYAESQFRQIVEDGVEYGIVHEWGLGDAPPRPFVVPVFEKHGQTIDKRISEALR